MQAASEDTPLVGGADGTQSPAQKVIQHSKSRRYDAMSQLSKRLNKGEQKNESRVHRLNSGDLVSHRDWHCDDDGAGGLVVLRRGVLLRGDDDDGGLRRHHAVAGYLKGVCDLLRGAAAQGDGRRRRGRRRGRGARGGRRRRRAGQVGRARAAGVAAVAADDAVRRGGGVCEPREAVAAERDVRDGDLGVDGGVWRPAADAQREQAADDGVAVLCDDLRGKGGGRGGRGVRQDEAARGDAAAAERDDGREDAAADGPGQGPAPRPRRVPGADAGAVGQGGGARGGGRAGALRRAGQGRQRLHHDGRGGGVARGGAAARRGGRKRATCTRGAQ
ncbi:hypothetical protein FGB62_47g166 [Gracilaria domingensis]|nr:hypothetical protein FGB62_47g166 [Gracilaria domingensis]